METAIIENNSSVYDYITTDPTKTVKIIGKGNEKYITIPELFSKTVEAYPDRSALNYQDEETGKWISITYREYKQRVDQIAKAFLKLGLEKKGRVAVLAFNSAEWFISKLAVIHAGGQIVGIYNTNSADACYYILEKSRANIVVVDEDFQLEKILEIKDKLPDLKAIIKTRPTEKDYNGIMMWKDLEEMNVDDFEEEYQARSKEITPNSCAYLIFTSGTTGNPKGALLSHDSAVFGVSKAMNALNFKQSNPEIFVSYLPLSHIAASIIDCILSIAIASSVYFADKNVLKGTLINTLLVARPTYFFGVPRIYEKIHEKIKNQTQNMQGILKMLLTWAQNSALNYRMDCINNKSATSISYNISKALVLNKLKAKIGLDRCKIFLSGAAPLNLDTFKFFLSLDILIFDAYGLTEAGVTFACYPNAFKFGSAGKVLPDTEGKIYNPDSEGIGEICTRGRNSFMGYLDDLEKTREVVDDELWIHSGDLGYIDKDGFLFITGRIKELIVTAGGENIPFINIENAVKSECAAISNALLVGDKRKFLVILITLKTEVDSTLKPTDELTQETIDIFEKHGLKYKLLSEVLKAGPDPKVLNLIQSAIDRANDKAMSRAQKVQKFIILPNDFSIPTGEFGPTMKLKRAFVIEKYKQEIDQLYV